MNHKIIDITLWQLITAYIFIVFLLIIVRWRKIPREKEIIIASLRMTIQLTIVGYLLTYIFKHANPLYTVLIILIMEGFAVQNLYSRLKKQKAATIKKSASLSLISGTLVTLLLFDFVVIHFKPWFDPQYFIPIAGMVVGNAMTAVTLGANALIEGMESNRALVEGALMLGATPKEASRSIVNNAFDSAILPTINSMVGMGIVFLPGMMTGVILSGISPINAIKYQIAIMLGITGSVSLTVILFLTLSRKAFFNSYDQLK